MGSSDSPAHAAGLTSCLLELGRLVRAVGFYAPDDPARTQLLERTHAAWAGELARTGALGICVEPDGFRVDGIEGVLDAPPVAKLADAMRRHGIAGLFLNPELAIDAVEGLAVVLAREVSNTSDAVGLDAAHAFEAWNGMGITVLPDLGQEATAPMLDLAAAHPPHGPTAEAAPARAAEPPKRIDDDPINAPGDPAADALVAVLRLLARAADLDAYSDHAANAIRLASELCAASRELEAYRAALVLARHATGGAQADGEEIRATAQSALRELCDGPLLGFIIERSCSDAPAIGVRAAQVLLQVGEAAVPPILQRLRNARDPNRLAQLSAVVIALGERSVSPLVDEIARARGAAARIAVQLAGELQNPKLVPSLVVCLHEGDPALRKDAAKALVTIGSASHQAFVDAMTSRDAEVARLSAHCLGLLGHRRAVRPLVDALERWVKRKEDSLAREAIRALADIADPRAVPALAAVATPGPWHKRGPRIETKLAAVSALESIEGAAAERALRELRAARDPKVAERAGQVLARRSPVDSASPS
ncbi:MAG: HEAT repeat domain-containing protein [Myxococcota bacterium]